VIEIQDLADSRIQEFKSLKDKSLRQDHLIIAETEKVVAKLIKSNIPIKKVLATPEFYLNYSPNAECYTASKELLAEIVGFNLHHGVMALAERPSDTLLNALDNKILVLNGLTSPENVGTLVRTAVGLGVTSIIVDKKTCSPFARRCIRVSMGNIFRMKVHHCENLIESLGKIEHQIIGTSNQDSSKIISTVKFPEKSALIIGSEGHGMDEDLKEFCQQLVKIPIDSEVAHLNASCAGAIALYNLTSS
jgi:tRNA G18 (ribose-2'-O)-methylase SpoU